MKKILSLFCFMLLCVSLNGCSVYTTDIYCCPTKRCYTYKHISNRHYRYHKPLSPTLKPKPHYYKPQPKPVRPRSNNKYQNYHKRNHKSNRR